MKMIFSLRCHKSAWYINLSRTVNNKHGFLLSSWPTFVWIVLLLATDFSEPKVMNMATRIYQYHYFSNSIPPSGSLNWCFRNDWKQTSLRLATLRIRFHLNNKFIFWAEAINQRFFHALLRALLHSNLPGAGIEYKKMRVSIKGQW